VNPVLAARVSPGHPWFRSSSQPLGSVARRRGQQRPRPVARVCHVIVVHGAGVLSGDLPSDPRVTTVATAGGAGVPAERALGVASRTGSTSPSFTMTTPGRIPSSKFNSRCSSRTTHIVRPRSAPAAPAGRQSRSWRAPRAPAPHSGRLGRVGGESHRGRGT